MDIYSKVHGRGTFLNPSSRFGKEQLESDLKDHGWVDLDEDLPSFKTEFFTDSTKSVITQNSSPDVGFDFSINPYRGCEHGCAYCYARPTHEYLSLSAGLDFESKIFVKKQAPVLLRQELSKKSWKPAVIAMSGVTDCYQPAERKFELTRGCLKVLLEFRNPAALITKNHLVCRDIDLLREMASEGLASVCLTITSLDTDLTRKLEPRTSSPALRLKAITALANAGVPVSVNIAPVIPGLTDHEIPTILKAASEAGATSAGMVPLRLPYSVKDHFVEWLNRHYPDRSNKVLGGVMDLREGRLNDPDFASRMRGTGKRAKQIADTFKVFRCKFNLHHPQPALRCDLFQRPSPQLSLF